MTICYALCSCAHVPRATQYASVLCLAPSCTDLSMTDRHHLLQADSPLVDVYRAQYPEHTIESHPTRGTVVFRVDENTTFAAEELVAMMLGHIQDVAAEYASLQSACAPCLFCPSGGPKGFHCVSGGVTLCP